MKNHATIRVDEDIITWETSFDKCTFFRTLVGPLPADATSPPCSKCANNPWNKSTSRNANNATQISTTSTQQEQPEIIKETTVTSSVSTAADRIKTKSTTTTSSTTVSSSSSIDTKTSTLCTQSLNGTPYLVKKRPLIITKPSSKQVTQTSSCHQLITTARPVATSTTGVVEKASKRISDHGGSLYRASSTPNLKKVGLNKSNKKLKELKGE